MIISASYKTDIPAFYGPWFMARLRAGFCRVINPYNSKLQTISLSKEAVNGIVFWTKNIGPMIKHLSAVNEMGFPFFVQHTITGYPRALETSVTNSARAVGFVHQMAKQFGKRSVVWRYDPILFTDLTPADWHLANFSMLAAQLSGLTDEVVVSFATFYKKTQRNLEKSAHENGFAWLDPTQDQKKEILTRCTDIAASHGMQLTVCAQPENLVPGAKEAHCIDAQRLTDLGGHHIKAKLHGNRPGCACTESRDIGEYDTCPHGCVYCYAVRDRNLARTRHRKHDPKADFLFPPAFIREEEPQITKQTRLL